MNRSGARRKKIVGIDPGATKCGYAAVFDDGARATLEVVSAEQLADRIERDTADGGVAAICIGDATTSAAVVRLCRERWPAIPIRLVDEQNTTWEARRLYWEEHPPRGWRALVPRGLLVPPEPLDGYAALLIVQRFRNSRKVRPPAGRNDGPQEHPAAARPARPDL